MCGIEKKNSISHIIFQAPVPTVYGDRSSMLRPGKAVDESARLEFYPFDVDGQSVNSIPLLY
jgi:hypothetical protein